MTWIEILLLGAVAALVLCPPKWDPAIRWKEFNIRWAERLEKRRNGQA